MIWMSPLQRDNLMITPDVAQCEEHHVKLSKCEWHFVHMAPASVKSSFEQLTIRKKALSNQFKIACSGDWLLDR